MLCKTSNPYLFADVIDSIEDVSEIRKTFFKAMLAERYIQIIEPAYEQLINRQIIQTYGDSLSEHSDSEKTDTEIVDYSVSDAADSLDDYYDGEDIGD